MAIDILSIQPHKVNRNLKGYSVFFYGEAKSGKTTAASKFPKPLLLATEKGYSTLAGVMAQPINTWSELKQVVRQLKSDAAKEAYETIIIDTVDIAYDYVTKYVCDNAKRPDGGYGVDKIGDIPYGGGYALVAQEFDECLRSIVQMGYGLVMISHSTDKTFTDESGAEYNKIVPTLDKRATNLVSRMADIIGYSRTITIEDQETVKLFLRGTSRFMAGSRFKYTPDHIDFTYKNLVNAIADAIEAQAKEDNGELYVQSDDSIHIDTSRKLDFDALMLEFNEKIGELQKDTNKSFEEYWLPRITEIVERYLGKGNKISNCNRTQSEAVSLIVDELKTLA